MAVSYNMDKIRLSVTDLEFIFMIGFDKLNFILERSTRRKERQLERFFDIKNEKVFGAQTHT